MRKFERLPAPALISEHWEAVGLTYEARRIENPSYAFSWPQINNQRYNQVALPVLSLQTGDHCSYCDKFPLHQGDETIDHFKPKTNPLYYRLVGQWENLYLACKHCQDCKKAQFDDQLLRPDDAGFSFTTYFDYNYTTHEIAPNPGASAGDQERARVTIEILNLNHPGVKMSRRHALERYRSDAAPVLDDYNYRFLFESLSPE